MSAIGLVLPDEFSHFSLDQTLHFAERADDAGFHSVWKQEASGSNGLLTLGAISQCTSDVRLGMGVASVFSRTPALLGMSAVTLDRLSDGRALLGLGVSSPPLVETWHGTEFERPLRRMREAMEIVRQVTAGGTVEYEGEVFDVGPYSMALDPLGDVPLLNAAIGPTNRRLTGEYADGWLPGFTPLSAFRENLSDVRSSARKTGRDPDDLLVAPWVPTAVDEDPDRAEYLARYVLAQEMAMGYNEQVGEYGFGDAPDEAHDRFRAGDREGAIEAISREMLDDLSVYGTRSEVREQLGRWYEAGADVVVAMPSMAASFEEILDLLDALGPDDR
ncbi:LLM class flavin-dependent oxidoreductase [Halomarina halobia]|uniref:LLM class flavin-dependent oxidoreductase n=1 Tax=Halomarina halobia TaxID=3033386 RepID=A0ABD6AEA5_9EURY|nr:LLM class flavin-dependent oxidoreductase [Halomarina sp. PSR21]